MTEDAPRYYRKDATVLEQVEVVAEINNLISRVSVTQRYYNAEKVNVEAVYTFPLPLEGYLLELEVSIGERRLKGIVKEKYSSQNEYEAAIIEGCSAILLERVEPGMYALNVGNIKPGEKVAINFVYAELLRWQEGCLRFLLPTTIAPRYGSPEAAGLEEHQIPESNICAENRFSLELKLAGGLARAEVESPSHAVRVLRNHGETVISLQKGSAAMDRDFVCLVRVPEAGRNMGLIAPDFEGYVAMGALVPPVPEKSVPSPRNLCLVIDCSGSMNGDSIVQARTALLQVVSRLRPEDCFNIIAFGSNVKELFPSLKPANDRYLARARRFIRRLAADMGGTETARAVEAALLDDRVEDVLLVTDGEIWNGEEVVARAGQSECRFFTVGVGSAVAEGFVKSLARRTGGVCELVSPKEDMVERIERQVERIFSPRCLQAEVSWPGSPQYMFPLEPAQVFAGDTLFIFARYKELPEGSLSLVCRFEGGNVQSSLNLDSALRANDDTLARLAAANLLENLDDDEILATCLKYRLISNKTSCLVVDREGEKADGLPELRKVAGMMAAGWGGTGTVSHVYEKSSFTVYSDIRLTPVDDSVMFRRHLGTSGNDNFLSELESHLRDSSLKRLATLEELEDLGLGSRDLAKLQNLIDEGFSEEEVVAQFIMFIVRKQLSWRLFWAARKLYRGCRNRKLAAKMRQETFSFG
jgi:Ca-activated chloride channel family protein